MSQPMAGTGSPMMMMQQQQQGTPQQQQQAQVQQQQQQQQQQSQLSQRTKPDKFKIRDYVQQFNEPINKIKEDIERMLLQNHITDPDSTKGDLMSTLRKNLDDLVLLCNKVELTLRTMLQTEIQSRETDKFNPYPVTMEACAPVEFQPNMLQDGTITYNQYVLNVEQQIQHSEEICKILGELAKPISKEKS